MTKQYTPFAILSPETGDDATGDNYALIRAELRRTGFGFTPVYGVWRGNPEHSFLVVLPDGNTGPDFDTVLELARQSNQESVLFVNSSREAVLIGVRDQDETRLGRWQTIPPVGPRPDSYTVGPDGRVYCAMEG